MKYLLILLFIFSLPACTAVSTLGDYLKENPVIASTSFRYATAKYIENGSTYAKKQERKNQVIDTASKVEAFIDANPTVTVKSVMVYLDSVISWDKLPPSDRILIAEILTIVEADLSAYEQANPLINVKELLNTVISAALLYGK